MKEENQTLNNFSKESELPLIFSASDIKPLSQNEVKGVLRAHKILNFIKANPQTTAYHISKSIGYDYTTTAKICRDLEYLKLICVYTIISKDNRVNKLLFVPQEVSYGKG